MAWLTGTDRALIKQPIRQKFSNYKRITRKNPTPEIALKLAVQLHQANRNEEALDLLFSILKQDLSAENGEVKQQFLSILSAIGNADPITNKYRRLLYSLLY